MRYRPWAKYALVDIGTGKVLATHPNRSAIESKVHEWKGLGFDVKVYATTGHGTRWRRNENWFEFHKRNRISSQQ